MTVQSPHNVLNIAFADGSNRNVSGEVDRAVWLQLMLPADGQTASNDYDTAQHKVLSRKIETP